MQRPRVRIPVVSAFVENAAIYISPSITNNPVIGFNSVELASLGNYGACTSIGYDVTLLSDFVLQAAKGTSDPWSLVLGKPLVGAH